MTGANILDWLAATSAAWLPILLDTSLKGAAILALASVVALAMKRSSASARQVIWFLAMTAILLMPVLSLALPSWRVLPDWAKVELPPVSAPAARVQAPAAAPQRGPQPQYTRPGAMPAWQETPPDPQATPILASTQPANAAVPSPVASAEVPPAPPVEAVPWQMRVMPWVMGVWMLGLAIALVPLLLGRLSLWAMHWAARPAADPQWQELLKRAKATLGLGRKVLLLQSRRHVMPMTWGLLRPRLLLPAEADGWSPELKWVVLLHELAHAKRWDCLTKLVAHLACSLYWFNPLAWWAFKRLQSEAEAACDNLVLCSTAAPAVGSEIKDVTSAPVNPCDYADHLLHIASGLRAGMLFAHSGIAMARKSNLEGRLLAILDGKCNRRSLTRWGLLLAALLVSAVVVPIASMTPADKTQEAIETMRQGPPAYSQEGLHARQFLLEQARAGKLTSAQATQVFEILHSRLQAAISGKSGDRLFEDEYLLMWQLALSDTVSKDRQHELLSLLGGPIECKFRDVGAGALEFRVEGHSMLPPQGMVVHYVARATAVDGKLLDQPLGEVLVVEKGETGKSSGTSWGSTKPTTFSSLKEFVAVELQVTWYRLPETNIENLPSVARWPEDKVRKALESAGAKKIASYQQRCELSAANNWTSHAELPTQPATARNGYVEVQVAIRDRQYQQGDEVDSGEFQVLHELRWPVPGDGKAGKLRLTARDGTAMDVSWSGVTPLPKGEKGFLFKDFVWSLPAPVVDPFNGDRRGFGPYTRARQAFTPIFDLLVTPVGLGDAAHQPSTAPTSALVIRARWVEANENAATQPATTCTSSASAPTSLPFTLGYDTTRITTPLLPDGRPDYLAAINEAAAKGVTKDNNAAVLVITAIDEKTALNDAVREKVLAKLELTLGKERVVFKDFPGKDGAGMTLDLTFWKAVAGPWQSKDFPALAAWLKENEWPLALFSNAAERSRWFIPLVPEEEKSPWLNTLTLNYGQIRGLSQALVIRSNLAVGEGRLEDAAPDLLAVHRLGMLLGQDSTLIGRQSGIAICSLADDALSRNAAGGSFSGPLAREISKELMTMQASSFAGAYDHAERYRFLNLVLNGTKGDAGRAFGTEKESDPLNKEFLNAWKEAGTDAFLRRINRNYDRLIDAMSKPSFAQRAKAKAEMYEQLTQLKQKLATQSTVTSPVDLAGDFLPLFPSIGRAQVLADIVMVQRDLAVVALGLCAYKADNGKYPDRLDALAPKYLPKVPEDFCSGKPFIYKTTGQEYVLYSVGENMTDDGGKARADRGDDLVVKTPMAASSQP